ncbi:bifunctional diguanylate cyclase/phosphodiesterase [Thioalkalivibrio sp. ALgr3]|uniref:putative bifunctional diguanylate cyclase/phosphodiesterase n=1 Tax=Thioalkalivibrio sp. ALgr3 TaxID=1239292 RepID=UPI000364BFBA|nr:EAL domain-containing protein [Thioalkalivibrio sp. ALgr3]
MEGLALSDCLDAGALRVDAFACYDEIARQGDHPVFVVIDETGQYQGLVTPRAAALFPKRIFADLLVQRPEPALAHDLSLREALQEMDRRAVDFLPVADTGGDFLGVVSRLSIADGLLRREAQQRDELERLLADYREELEQRRISTAVFEATSEGIMVTDAQQRIVQVNPAFERTTGWSRQEALGETPALLHSGAQDAGFYAGMWKALNKTDAWEGEIWNRRKNGEVYPEWLHINVIRGDDGEIHYYVGVFSDATKHEEMRQRLHYFAYHDALTGLPNRQLFMDRLEQAMRDARREGKGLAVAFVDLNGFKEVNDTRGHAAGDELLKQVADTLQGAVREVDTVARFGGDEFVLLLPDCGDGESASVVMERVLSALNRPFSLGGHDEVRTSGTAGISRFPADGDTGESLLMAADNALYEAKAEQRAGYRFFSASGYDQFVERVQMLDDLQAALENGDITLEWQPQVALATGRLVGLEALARWVRGDGSRVRPDLFVRLAEQSGLIDDLGTYIFDLAMREVAGLSGELLLADGGDLRFAVNVSPLQVHPPANGDQDLASVLQRIAASHQVGLDRIELEVTETALSRCPEEMYRVLECLGAEGARVAIDDFGTGCSNLAVMRRLPIHKVKLDRSMVTNLVEGAVDRDIVTAVVGMARSMKITVLAEGVETQEQADMLRDLGCDYAQGYLFGRPQPMSMLRETLRGTV